MPPEKFDAVNYIEIKSACNRLNFLNTLRGKTYTDASPSTVLFQMALLLDEQPYELVSYGLPLSDLS